MFICVLALTACRKGENTPTPTTESGPETPGGDQSPPTASPGIAVGAVNGNTASLNAVAEFAVQLESAPAGEVTISVASSNEAEGKPDQSQLTFTSDNWFQPQTVVIRGTNPNVVNGEQNYQIVLGPAASSDPLYNGLDPEDVTLRGIELTLAAPGQLDGLVANLPAILQPQVRYTGNSLLSFALTEAPNGMAIDLSSGLISWTPQQSDEGQSYSVGLVVNDGNKFAETTFNVTVLQPDPLAVEIEGNILRVVDENSTLNGMTITQLDGDNLLSQLNLGKLSVENAPSLPAWVTPLSDVFVVRGSFEMDVEIRFAVNTLPDNISIGSVNPYNYINVMDVASPLWSPVGIEKGYEGTSEAPVLAVRLTGLQGLSVWSYAAPADTTASSEGIVKTRVLSSMSAAQTTITCEQQSANSELIDTYICTTTADPAVKVTIEGFGSGESLWDGITKELMMGYIFDAQAWLTRNNLAYDKEFKILVEESDGTWAGYVSGGPPENGKVLHLARNDRSGTNWLRGTIVHEYFHHVQFHSDNKMAGKETTGWILDGRWITEGSARWFQDEILDSFDTYDWVGPRVAEVGIDSLFAYNTINDKPRTSPYQRFAFFKLWTSKCPNFTSNFKSLLNIDQASDPSGIVNAVSLFGTFGCNFGDHFGADKSATLEAALAYYNYATQFENKMSLLDSNEADTRFNFDKPNYSFNAYWSNVDLWISSGRKVDLLDVSNIPAAGAYSFKVPAVSGTLPAGKVAELIVESNQAILVSITSADSQFQGTNAIGNRPHNWFSTADQHSYIYNNANGAVPELFVTLVNADTDKAATVKVSFQIRDELTANPTITNYVTGDQVTNRVITIQGELPAEVREATTTVVVTVNGIATTIPMNPDGTYSAGAVVALGQNIVKVQGFHGELPTTNVKVITLVGVESQSGGRNALIASRAVFVLRWDTANTDVDIYTTDKNNATIWYNSLAIGPGNLDYDVQTGFGPEVVSYRATGDNVGDLYLNGTFELDVHYFSGTTATKFTLDVILNETEGDNLRVLRFESVLPLTNGTAGGGNRPEGVANPTSRFNNIVRIVCSPEGVCSLGAYDTSILTVYGQTTPQ